MSSGWTLGRHSKWKQKKCVENSTLELWNFPNFLFPFWMLSSTRNELNESEYYKTCAPRIVACQALQMEDWSNSSYSGKFNVEKSPNLSVDCDKNKSHKHLSALLYRIQHFFIQLLITIKSDRRGTILRCLEPSESMKMVGKERDFVTKIKKMLLLVPVSLTESQRQQHTSLYSLGRSHSEMASCF